MLLFHKLAVHLAIRLKIIKELWPEFTRSTPFTPPLVQVTNMVDPAAMGNGIYNYVAPCIGVCYLEFDEMLLLTRSYVESVGKIASR